MAKVLLINPPSETLGPDNKRITRVLYPSPPAGIALVAACLEQAGHLVKILDLIIQPQSENQVLETIKHQNPDAIGFSVLGPSFHTTQACMRTIRKALPKIKLFAGNALPSEFPKWFLNEIPDCDAVIVGEGEVTTAELIDNNFSKNTPGTHAADFAKPRLPVGLQLLCAKLRRTEGKQALHRIGG
jgi:anaerobic magnesium-protoporphyrin IX monomethyl ester cyclase